MTRGSEIQEFLKKNRKITLAERVQHLEEVIELQRSIISNLTNIVERLTEEINDCRHQTR